MGQNIACQPPSLSLGRGGVDAWAGDDRMGAGQHGGVPDLPEAAAGRVVLGDLLARVPYGGGSDPLGGEGVGGHPPP